MSRIDIRSFFAAREPTRDSWAESPIARRILALITAASAVMIAIVGCGSPSLQAPRWNVLVVLVDTLRSDHLPIYGYDRATAPFLNEFSRKGVVFEQARSQAGCTFPSVNSLFTSQYPQLFQRSVKEHGLGIPEGVPTLAEMLRAAGYSTGAVSSSPIVRVNPSKRNPDGGYGAGFDQFDDSCEWEPADCVNEAAFKILDDLQEPFFMYLHYLEPHGPYQPPEAHDRAFAREQYDKPWVADGTLFPLLGMLYQDLPAVEFTDQDLAHAIDLYDDEILYFDRQLFRMIQRLETDGMLDRTLIAFVADHGEEFLEHGFIGHCYDFTWDSSVKTPFVLWFPEFKRAGRTPALAQNLDLVPTILDYLGIDASQYDLDGTSLRPVLEEERSVHRYVFGLQRFARWVTDGRYKLSYNIKTGEAELFDLVLDPGERTTILARRPEVGEELTEILMRWIDDVEGDLDVADRVQKASEATEKLRALGYLQ